MTVKEFFELIQNTAFSMDEGEERLSTTIKGFGHSSYGGGHHPGAFQFRIKNRQFSKRLPVEKYNQFSEIPNDILQSNIIQIDEIYLQEYSNESNAGNIYFGNSNTITITIEKQN